MEGSSPQRQTTVENESDNSLFQRDFSNLGSSVDDIKESVRSCEVQHRELQRHMERLLNVTADLKNKLMEKEAQIKKLMEENARLRGPCDCWMQIFVKSSLSGKTITLDVKRTNTIDDVNAMIQRKEGIPRNRRTTSFYVMFGGKRLEGERTVAHYNIEKGSTLHFVGRFIDIPQIAVSVSNSNGKGITLYPTVINTIDDLKLMIEDKTGIPVDEQMLRFGVAGRQLEGSRKLLDCCIYDGSFIYLEPCKHSGTVEVCVLNLSLKRFMVEVDSFDKIGHLKGIIRREEGLRPDGDRSFDLVFNGNVLDEDRTIGSYKIVGKSQIHIVLKEAGGGGADVPV